MTRAEREDLLVDAASRSDSDPVRITIREFVDKWDASRRGHRIVLKIRRDLKRHGLRTVPDFASGWIDNTITLLPLKSPDDTTPTEVDGDADAIEADEIVSVPEVALRIGSLQSAAGPLCSVAMDTSLETAQSLMMRHDYSQLAVMSGSRDLRGAVTWESIAQARLRDENATLRDAIVPAHLVDQHESLLERVPLIIESSFVFVREDDNSIVGIVTTADLSAQFATLANPFFLLGEIERRLRLLLDQVFSRDELAQMVDPADGARNVSTVDDLTMGEYIRIIENPNHWDRIGLPVDRRIFVDALNDVREIRNDVMHFSPDPLAPSQVDELQNFLRWCERCGRTARRSECATARRCWCRKRAGRGKQASVLVKRAGLCRRAKRRDVLLTCRRVFLTEHIGRHARSVTGRSRLPNDGAGSRWREVAQI